MKIVAWVPIKLNNERLPNKNILPLGGKPLCCHMLDTLLKVDEIDNIYVFCSDEKIKQYIPLGVTFLKRSKDLDSFNTGHYDLVDSFVSKIDADIYINAHVTNPFVKPETIKKGLEKVINREHDSAHTVLPMRQYFFYKEKPLNFTRETAPRTQDIEPLYVDTNLHIYRKDMYLNDKTRYGKNPFFIEVDESEALDIDYPADYELAKYIYNSKKS
jgi:CMP-N-acetylneuraminic acid synthetase